MNGTDPDEAALPTRFVFVEGVMGAGKTITAEFLVEELRRQGRAARFLPEGPTVEEPTHPLRLAPTLPHGRTPWVDVTPEEYLRLSLDRWRAFVAGAAPWTPSSCATGCCSTATGPTCS